MPGQQYYSRTTINEAKGERWFCSKAEAIAAGWRASKSLRTAATRPRTGDGGYSTNTVPVADAPCASITMSLRKPGPFGSQDIAPPKDAVPTGAPSTNQV